MIFETMSYTDNDGDTIAIGDIVYPAQDFDMKTYQVNEAVKKTQFPGRWPSFSYPEYRVISVAGEILGTTAADYNTKERALKAVIQPPYRFFVTARRHGKLSLTFFGDATTYYAYVILDELDIPAKALYPTVNQYSISWISFEPYLVNAGTGAYARDL